MAMKPEVKQLWVDALRSRRYKQTRGYLHSDGGFCCLGVLCDLHIKATGAKWEETSMPGHAAYHDNESTLPDAVVRWAGLSTDDPRTHSELFLSDLNDGDVARAIAPASLRQIADIIEAEL